MKHLKEILLVDNSGEQCYLITKERVTEIVELRSTQHEADTRMMTHVRHDNFQIQYDYSSGRGY